MKALTTYLLLFVIIVNASAQTKPMPTIRANSNSLIMYLGSEHGNFNGVNDIPNPFTYDFGTEQEMTRFSLVSVQDSITLMLRYGVTTDCAIIRQSKGDTVICHFTSHKLVKAATFSDAYRKANEGKTIIEVPEPYELINIVFALTNYGKTDAIYKETAYYKDVMAHFSRNKNHPIVRVVDSLLTQSNDNYANLKKDSYAYRFEGDKLTEAGVYDRVSWGEFNELAPYISLLEQFAKQSTFRIFYKHHKPYYAGLIADFRRNVDVATMKAWLEKHFPTTYYSAVKVLFSPLVGWNQSANNFSDNGFTEAQAHINFPFVDGDQKKQSQAITRGQRMTIAFTELNHSYLNPEADKYAKDIAVAFHDLPNWITPGKTSAGYNNALSCFEEYMNYALVTLLDYDLFDKKDAETLRIANERGMVKNRGFQQFNGFDQELLRLYQQKKPGQTVADLYPAIIAWAARQ